MTSGSSPTATHVEGSNRLYDVPGTVRPVSSNSARICGASVSLANRTLADTRGLYDPDLGEVELKEVGLAVLLQARLRHGELDVPEWPGHAEGLRGELSSSQPAQH